jgi:hypothetical protein
MTSDVDPVEQQEILLEESEERAADLDASPGTFLEHRTSDEATPPIE